MFEARPLQLSQPSGCPFVSPPPITTHPGTYSRVHYEVKAQRDSDIEAVEVIALHQTEFQQLRVGDFYAGQGEMLTC